MDADTVEQMYANYEALLPKIAALQNWQSRRDLINLARTCENLRQDISIAEVECRRLRRPTVKYMEFLQQFQQALNNLEQYTTLALLSDC
jgi:hypothetical protein